MLRRHLIALIVFPLSFFAGSVLRAEDQTTTFSPVTRWNRDYSIQLTPYSMNDANVPGLQSFVAGAHQDEWVILAGKTGGQHDFETGNRTAWVVNPVTQQAWGRTLDDPMSGLSTHTVNSLSSTNAQSYQTGQTLFITGGYVYDSHADNFTTYKELTASGSSTGASTNESSRRQTEQWRPPSRQGSLIAPATTAAIRPAYFAVKSSKIDEWYELLCDVSCKLSGAVITVTLSFDHGS